MQQSRYAAHTPCAVDRYRSPTEKMLLEVGDFLDAATPRMPNRHRAPRSKIHSEIRPHASLLHPIMNQKTLDRYRSPELLTAACPPRHVVLDRAAQHPRCERQTGHFEGTKNVFNCMRLYPLTAFVCARCFACARCSEYAARSCA